MWLLTQDCKQIINTDNVSRIYVSEDDGIFEINAVMAGEIDGGTSDYAPDACTLKIGSFVRKEDAVMLLAGLLENGATETHMGVPDDEFYHRELYEDYCDLFDGEDDEIKDEDGLHSAINHHKLAKILKLRKELIREHLGAEEMEHLERVLATRGWKLGSLTKED